MRGGSQNEWASAVARGLQPIESVPTALALLFVMCLNQPGPDRAPATDGSSAEAPRAEEEPAEAVPVATQPDAAEAPPAQPVPQATDEERAPLEARGPDRFTRDFAARRRQERIGRGLLIGGGTLIVAGGVVLISGLVVAGHAGAHGESPDPGISVAIAGGVGAGLGVWTTVAGAIVRRTARRRAAPIAAVGRHGAVLGMRLSF